MERSSSISPLFMPIKVGMLWVKRTNSSSKSIPTSQPYPKSSNIANPQQHFKGNLGKRPNWLAVIVWLDLVYDERSDCLKAMRGNLGNFKRDMSENKGL